VIKLRILYDPPVRRTGSYAKKHDGAKKDPEEIRYEMSGLFFILAAGIHF
jgi:hypothetical protein